MKTSVSILLTLVVFVTTTAAKPVPDVAAVAAGNTKFALKLYDQLNDEKGNLFLSPYSISTALAMTYAGARGETEAEMAKALQFPLFPDKEGGPLGRERLHAGFSGLKLGLREAQKKGDVQCPSPMPCGPRRTMPFGRNT